MHPLIIAHRGASAVAPENTKAAIETAVQVGSPMIELDLQLTADRRIVVFHDDRLERLTNGKGWLRAIRYSQLIHLDAGSWFAPTFAAEKILLASQAVRLVPTSVSLNLELKPSSTPLGLIVRIAHLIQRTRLVSRLLLSSSNVTLLQYAQRRMPNVALALICHRLPTPSLRQAIHAGLAAWHPHHTLLTPRCITQAHAAGLRVHAWTVDDVTTATRLIRQGVDGIFTNHPQRFLKHFRV